MDSILIVGIPRSGTTSLLKSISTYYKLKQIFEPTYEELTNVDVGGSVVKICAGYWFKRDQILEQINRFDKVVLLTRRDLKSAAESLYVLKNHNNRIINKQWSIRNIPNIDKEYSQQKESHEIIKELSEITSIEINYYEDLYSVKKLKDESIGLNPEWLESRHKLRRDQVNRTLI
jgi:hypothetical protein